MNFFFTMADLALIAVVALMAVAVAYIPSPRAKSLVYMLPIPFSVALLSTGKGVDATHMAGFGMLWVFASLVWLLHAKWRMPIMVALGLAMAFHSAASLAIARYVPRPDTASASGVLLERQLFWGLAVCLFLLAGAGLALPYHHEMPHRSPLPFLFKLPLVVMLVAVVVAAKVPLRGFMPAFPMVTVFAAYEARHSLYTLVAGMPVFLLGCDAMLVACRLLIPYHPGNARGIAAGLGYGWLLYIPVYLLLARLLIRKSSKSQARASTAQPAQLT